MIRSISEYIDAINSILYEWHSFESRNYSIWFRGEEDIKWKLRPTIYRNHNLNYYERELTRDFKNQAYTFLNENYPKNEFEWMFLMQHYGLPTRLLDFTESSLVALYFAVCNYKNIKNGKVWILDPMSLNESFTKNTIIPYFTSPILKDYSLIEPILNDKIENSKNITINRQINAELPIAVRPIRNNTRSIAQKATFIVFGRNCEDLNEIISSQRNEGAKKVKLTYIEIDGSHKQNILKDLAVCGITHSVIFPELSGIAYEIKQNYSEDFIGYIRKKEFIELNKKSKSQ